MRFRTRVKTNFTRKTKIIILCVAVTFLAALSIVYAAVSTTLIIQTSGASVKPWDVRFLDASYDASSTTGIFAATSPGTTISSTSRPSDTLIISNIVLNDYDSKVIFKFKFKNYGQTKAKFSDFSTSVDSSSGNYGDYVVAELRYSSTTSNILSSNPSGIVLNSNSTSSYFYLTIRYKTYSEKRSVPPSSAGDFTVTLTPKWVEST